MRVYSLEQDNNFIISEATAVAVLGYFEAYRENSRDLFNDFNLSYGTVSRILKKITFVPWALVAGDQHKRLVICHWYINYCLQNVNDFCNIHTRYSILPCIIEKLALLVEKKYFLNTSKMSPDSF